MPQRGPNTPGCIHALQACGRLPGGTGVTGSAQRPRVDQAQNAPMRTLISMALFAIVGLMSSEAALAQWHNSPQFDRDLRDCDRRGVNFEFCMWDRGWQRGRGHRWERVPPNQHWHQPPPRHWHQPPPHHWHQPPPPRRNQRLSDMQRRALENCNFLPPAEQPRCRATVWSTVR